MHHTEALQSKGNVLLSKSFNRRTIGRGEANGRRVLHLRGGGGEDGHIRAAIYQEGAPMLLAEHRKRALLAGGTNGRDDLK